MISDPSCSMAQAVAEWEATEAERRQASAGMASATEQQPAQPQFVAYVPLPDQKEIEMRVLDKKKAELLAKYTSEALLREQQQARSLLNVRQ